MFFLIAPCTEVNSDARAALFLDIAPAKQQLIRAGFRGRSEILEFISKILRRDESLLRFNLSGSFGFDAVKQCMKIA